MSAFQLPGLDFTSRARTKLAELRDAATLQGLGDVLQSLPPFVDTAFTIEHGVPVLNIGPIETGPYVFDCKLYSTPMPSAHPSHPNPNSAPLHRWVENLEKHRPEEKIQKSAFAWDKALFKGLFTLPRQPASAALVHYYFIQWAASVSGSVGVDLGLTAEALCAAFRILKETEGFKERIREENIPLIENVPPPVARPVEIDRGNDTDGDRKSVRKNIPRIEVTPPVSRPIETGRANDTDGDEKSVREVLDYIKSSMPVVELLPPLEKLNLRFEHHNKSGTDYLPLRLYIGTSVANPNSEVWMYLRYPGGKKGGPQQPCEIEEKTEHGKVSVVKTLRTGTSTDLDDATLADALKPSKHAVGQNYLPLTFLTQYCFLLKYEEEGLEPLRGDTIVYNASFRKYLENGVKYYYEGTSMGKVPRELLVYGAKKKSKGKGKTGKASNPRRSGTRKVPKPQERSAVLEEEPDTDINSAASAESDG